MVKQNRPSVGDEDTYKALRRDGASKEKAARIANAQADPNRAPSKKGGRAKPYEEWTKQELYDRAKDIGIDGRSNMAKEDLIEALRQH
ncbi:MAG: Rho termination factor [Pseudomonadota bacterium]